MLTDIVNFMSNSNVNVTLLLAPRHVNIPSVTLLQASTYLMPDEYIDFNSMGLMSMKVLLLFSHQLFVSDGCRKGDKLFKF